MTELHPRENPLLIGHDEIFGQLVADWQAGKLHHGLLLAAPRGMGKATLAYRLARVLLSGQTMAAGEPGHPVFRRVAGGSHGDLMVVEQEYDEKKDEPAREISAEEARGIGAFLSQTAAEGNARVVIIDAADALNNHAANSILKVLEEPPPGAFLILVSHSPGRLLPTIRSRCRLVRLNPLSQADALEVMEPYLPDMSGMTRARLAELAGHSPGLALELEKRGGMELYAALAQLLAEGGQGAEIWKFSEKFAGKAVHAQWQAMQHVLLTLMSRAAKAGAGEAAEQEIVAGEADLLHKLLSRRDAGGWAKSWQACAETMEQAARLHQDYRQTLLALLHGLEKAA